MSDDLKPCPFCGGEAEVSHYETESLWSHDQVTYTTVGCAECNIHFNTEPGFEVEAPEAWNTRIEASRPSDPGPGCWVPAEQLIEARREIAEVVEWLRCQAAIYNDQNPDLSPLPEWTLAQKWANAIERGDHKK